MRINGPGWIGQGLIFHKPSSPACKSTGRPGEEKNPPHHRGIFIGHEKLNPVDFWHEYPDRAGKVEQLRTMDTRSGKDRAMIKTLNAWKSPKGETLWGKRADWVHYYGTIEGHPAEAMPQ